MAKPATETAPKSRTLIWLWLAASLAAGAWLIYALLEAQDKTVFMPGPLTSGHHQIGLACNACHGAAWTSDDVLQQACVDCHGEDRKKPFDSHPRTKFADPRNADTLANINALRCVTCHTEHRPAMTGANGLTQPVDFCAHCHQDIGTERPSHQGMKFDTCASAGCHNFHNNRALYTDFLVKHLGEPKVLPKAVLPAREFGQVLNEIIGYPAERYPIKPLTATDVDAPAAKALTGAAHADWLSTAHAQAGVNCSACHVAGPPGTGDATETNSDNAEKTTPAVWTDKPDHRACAQCHELEVKRFQRGKHGMRLALDLPPMTPAEARLPMRAEAAHETLSCTSCHGAHRFDVRRAAVDACLDCHNDKHSLAYKQSPHFDLWEKEVAGTGTPGSGVSCASCHMPRISFDVNEWMSRIMVEHNQNATLSPNEKMIRPACLHCHGLGFTLDALADRPLIDKNFRGAPTVHVQSMDLADADQKRAQQEKEAASGE